MPSAISLSNVCKRFPVPPDPENSPSGIFTALEDVSFSLESGSVTLICGANGSGKSLLMSIIAGLEPPSSGVVSTSGRVGLVFQDPDSQILGETPWEDVAFGAGNLGLSKKETAETVRAALAETGLAARADYPARSLSGGEKRRLAVAGVLAMNAEIIIFDEPYANMDFQGVIQVNRLIQNLHNRGKTIVILTHEIEKCLALAGRFIVLYRGKIVFDGSAGQALNEDLESWGIHHPLRNIPAGLKDLLWQ
jgi:biotin transport system ATP-binding protein